MGGRDTPVFDHRDPATGVGAELSLATARPAQGMDGICFESGIRRGIQNVTMRVDGQLHFLARRSVSSSPYLKEHGCVAL